jgi:muramoyltetrapeptide carboxypeptidase
MTYIPEHIPIKQGATIGLIAPCIATREDKFAEITEHLTVSGFAIKTAENYFSTAYSYAGTPQERCRDLSQMAQDPEVDAVFMHGGWVCAEMLPYIDYDIIRKHPKPYMGYSDCTTLLGAIYAKTGVPSFYGAPFRPFQPFKINADEIYGDIKQAKGKLLGGYLTNFTMLVYAGYFNHIQDDLILFIEDHIIYSPPELVASYFAYLAQSGIFGRVRGMVFGNYAHEDEPQPMIDVVLKRLSDEQGFPVVKCRDFGHLTGNNVVWRYGMEVEMGELFML